MVDTLDKNWYYYVSRCSYDISRVHLALEQSGRSPKVVALFSVTNFSSNIIELLQLHDAIQIWWNYA